MYIKQVIIKILVKMCNIYSTIFTYLINTQSQSIRFRHTENISKNITSYLQHNYMTQWTLAVILLFHIFCTYALRMGGGNDSPIKFQLIGYYLDYFLVRMQVK